MSGKKFSGDEINQIINRATKLQQADLNMGLKKRNGLTQEELEQIGEEMGLAREYLRSAVFEMEENKVLKYSDSNETHIYEERDLAIELNSEAWDELTSELRHYFGTHYGKIQEDPRKLEWTHMSLSGLETRVNITNRGEHARLRLSQRVGLGSTLTESVMYGLGLTIIVTSLVFGFFPTGPLATIFSFFGYWVAGGALVYVLDKAWRKSKHRKLHQLADKITAQLFNSQKSDSKKKLKFETDLAEKQLNPTIENILIRDSDEEETTDQSKFRNRQKT